MTFEHAGRHDARLAECERNRASMHMIPALCDLAGRDENQLLTLTEHELLRAEDQPGLGARLADCSLLEADDYEADVRWRHGDEPSGGSTRDPRPSTGPTPPALMRWAGQDITEGERQVPR